MFTLVYLFRVPEQNIGAFLSLQREASTIYREHGALEDETLAPVDLDSRHGCKVFADELEIKKNEKIFMGLSRYKDSAHHEEVMARVDSDQRIDELFGKVTNLLDIKRVIYAQFERVD